jgi:hypothetical protein
MREPHTPDPFDVPASATGGGEETTRLLVSLFLILLTFFIVLNSISNRALGKAGQVMDSVTGAFKGGDKPYHPGVEGIDLLARDDISVHRPLFYDEGRATLEALIDFPGEVAAPGGNVLQVELRTSVLFPTDDKSVRADQTKFLNALADLLKKEGLNEERAVEIMFAVRSSAFGKNPGVARLATTRATALARELEDRGVPGRSITTGLVPDKRDILWLTFTSRSRRVMETDRTGGQE